MTVMLRCFQIELEFLILSAKCLTTKVSSPFQKIIPLLHMAFRDLFQPDKQQPHDHFKQIFFCCSNHLFSICCVFVLQPLKSLMILMPYNLACCPKNISQSDIRSAERRNDGPNSIYFSNFSINSFKWHPNIEKTLFNNKKKGTIFSQTQSVSIKSAKKADDPNQINEVTIKIPLVIAMKNKR